uniref:Sorbin and SH3 domain-containing protein 2 n=1 Tax=Hemiscolopendra marginata TaxID=943146 RepID=A0A646QJH6_9MYRI
MDSPENPVQNGNNNVTRAGEGSAELQRDSSIRSSAPPSDQTQAKTSTISITQAEIHSTQVSVREISDKENQDGVWSPKQTQTSNESKKEEKSEMHSETTIVPVWKPFGVAHDDRIHYKPVKIESTGKQDSEKTEDVSKSSNTPPTPPLKGSSGTWESKKPLSDYFQSHEVKGNTRKSQLSPTFVRLNGSSNLPRSQSPTITLLQKKREGQIPKNTVYVDHKMNSKDDALSNLSSSIPALNDNLYCVKSAEIHDDYRKIHLEPIKHQGVGPTDEQGLPVTLRTVIKDENKTEWYKKMYRSLHRLGDSSEDDYVVVKYRRRGRIPYSSSGYMSEPEPERDDYYLSSKFSTLDRRRPRFTEEPVSKDNISTSPKGKSNLSSWSPPSARYSSDIYKNQPRKIEDYEPGRSSIAEREAKLDEAVDQHGTRYKPSGEKTLSSYLFKDGYESDSSLVYKKHSSDMPSASEQRMWYREIQKGGDIPLTGLRKVAPDRPKESPHRYLESEVNIHYKAPIRNLEKEYIEEEELKLRQEEMMKQFYEEEKKKKYIQELNDIENRRHSDNFIPSQKSPIPLDRYDNPFESSVSPQPRARTPEPKTVARARYNFTAQNIRELSFNKGDIIIITRQIDRNWYEGEHHGMIGLFPVNYVEVISYDSVRSTPKKLTEGLAKAKFHFRAQTSLELSLVKGELVILTRRVDRNWYMGRIGGREGIFPVSYVDVIREPADLSRSPSSPVPKPVASPVSRALIMNGSATTPHPLSYQQPNLYNQKLNSHQNPYATMRRYPPIRPPEPMFNEKKQPIDQSLHIDTQSEPIPYRALYDYQPQNEDELELREGDTVFVMEKCDDGWYVGSSLRSGVFGTFPGNYVERM